ncbi:protein terminal ear1 homolog [Vitis riparia]|uniref:protein terminal ear1 homolog n=1 Tax=Vitis riparia TaxID=96939 RepID=UPI00155B3A8C|nr:protein terminal ear1 homolog [Vitis riparia]
MASQLLNTNPRGSKPLNPNAHAFQPWKSLKAYYLPHHLYETQGRMQLPATATVLDFAYQPVSLPLLRYSGLGCYSAQFHHQPLHLRASSILYPSGDFPITYVGSTKDSVTEMMEDLGDSVSSRGETRKVSGVPVKKMIAPRLKRSQRRSSMPGGDKNGTSVWRARKFLNGDGCGDDPLPPSDVNALELSLSGKTTVMIRNIPNKMSRKDMLQLLDECCQVENRNAELQCDSLRTEYDFVYLPMDFRFKCSNKGYAFVNFTTDVAAFRICKYLHNTTWAAYGTKKICEITGARIQGKEALVGHFRNSNFECSTDDYLPVVLSPPRDGMTAITTPRIVGRRVVSNKSMRKH